MENRAYAIATGTFVLLLAVLLSASAIWLSSKRMRGASYDLITEASVAGLSVGAPIRLRGVEVGEVQQIGFDPEDQRRVRVRALLDSIVRLPEGTRGSISYLGLSGTGYVELDYPDSASGTLSTSAAVPARIPLRASGLTQLTADADRLVETFSETLGRVNGVLTPENSRNLSQFVARANEAAAAVGVLTRELQPAARDADHFIGKAGELVQTVQSTARDADALIVAANSRGGAVDAIRDGALSTGQAARRLQYALVTETLPRFDVLAERLSRATDSLDQLLRQLQNEPQSLVFGLPSPTPGPGEPGFRQAASK
jgi:phospholipid/cholesterol/gamma-HCH transport system substrate-binding protein